VPQNFKAANRTAKLTTTNKPSIQNKGGTPTTRVEFRLGSSTVIGSSERRQEMVIIAVSALRALIQCADLRIHIPSDRGT
jgi:hypothetical protein